MISRLAQIFFLCFSVLLGTTTVSCGDSTHLYGFSEASVVWMASRPERTALVFCVQAQPCTNLRVRNIPVFLAVSLESLFPVTGPSNYYLPHMWAGHLAQWVEGVPSVKQAWA